MVVSTRRSHVGEQVSVGSRVSATSEHGAGRIGAVAPGAPRRCFVRVLRATTWILLAVVLCNGAWAKSPPQRRGKVIIIRGAFTVFSLGMNELGEKLAQYGLDVEVVADISAGRAASKLKSEYRRNQDIGPIVFIGHSRGAELGPKEARYLQQYKIPVKLVVMVDAVHQTTIPSNVERCVNLYQHSALSLPHGVPARAESKYTQMVNTDIDQLSTRDQAGSINHFNIDASPWIHDLVVAEVLKVCPAASSDSLATTARQSTTAQEPATAQRSAPAVTRRTSRSGLTYPDGVAGRLWYGSTDNRSSTTTQSPTQDDSSRTNRARTSTSKKSSASRTNTAQRSGATKSLQSGNGNSTGSATRTAARPPTTKTPRSASSGTKRTNTSSDEKPTASATKKAAAPATKPGSAKNLHSNDSSKPAATNSSKKSDSEQESSSDKTKSEQSKSEPIQVHVNG